jgi:hypothetical protein
MGNPLVIVVLGALAWMFGSGTAKAVDTRHDVPPHPPSHASKKKHPYMGKVHEEVAEGVVVVAPDAQPPKPAEVQAAVQELKQAAVARKKHADMNAARRRVGRPPLPMPPSAHVSSPEVKPQQVPAQPAQPNKPQPAQSQVVIQSQPAQRDPKIAAAELYLYVTKTQPDSHMWGTKAQPNARIKDWQAGMGLKGADGIYGPATRAAGKALIGQTFPVRR